MTRAPLLALATALGLSACQTTSDPQAPVVPVTPLSGAPIQTVETDYTASLQCLASFAGAQNYPAPRVAVGHISDLTGADDYMSGRRLTQGATLMAISAADTAGMRVVERFDMGVVQVELDYAQNGLVRDAPNRLRQIQQGQIEGADLYLVGGLTEFNPNIRSSGRTAYASVLGDSGGAGTYSGSEYVIDIGMDLRLIDVRSTEVIAVRAFRKQVRGREIESGVFAFMDDIVIDIGGGERALEPVQTAVRAMVDRAVFEFMASLYDLQTGSCVDGQPARARVQQAQHAQRQVAPQPAPRQVAQTAPQRQPSPVPAAPSIQSPAAVSTAPDRSTHTGYGLHLASYRTMWNANRQWPEIRSAYEQILGDRHGRIVADDGGNEGTIFRVMAGPWPNEAAAASACRDIRNLGGQCAVTAYAGDAMMRY
ncbi:CsgG/HfaB family protein [Maricaulis sp. D1M11]|uniref:CsgG/HfaB family protein n=1 Tax=Maricaulis sp. D1M11 TaxID=3076117 RepID=UPI0039B39587